MGQNIKCHQKPEKFKLESRTMVESRSKKKLRTTRVKEQVVLMQVLMPKMLFVVSINMLTQKPVQSNFGTMNAVTKTRVHSLLLPRLTKMNMEIGPKKTQKILLHDPLMKQLVVLTFAVTTTQTMLTQKVKMVFLTRLVMRH